MAREEAKRRVPKETVKVKGPKGQEGKCVIYTDGSIRIDWVRFSYPHLRKAYAGDDGGEPKFGLVGLLGKKTHKDAIELIEDRMDEILKENKVKAIPASKKFLRDGDETDKDGYEGMMTVSARETKRPPLRGRDNDTIEPEDADEWFQGGYWGSMLIRPWYQNNKYGKRINAGLSSAQFLMKDETFGEGGLTEEDLDDTFEKFDGDDDDDRGSRRRRRSRDDDDDDDRGLRRRRSRDDDDDDDRGSRSSSRRRSRVEDDEDDDI